jgi:predicted amidohydrolase YtcJ
MRKLLLPLVLFICISCTHKESADLFVYNATIYTVDSSFSTAEAMMIKDGKILETGSKSALEKKYNFADSLNAGGQFIYPGLIDAHAHFKNYGESLKKVNLVGTNSWAEVLERTKTFAAENPTGWITGRGWDQNDWDNKEFPDNTELSAMFPDRPVLLTRIDGHAAIANQLALDAAAVHGGDKLVGGEITTRNGKLTGLLVDNAIGLVAIKIPKLDAGSFKAAMLAGQANCFAVGLTTVDDCGLSFETISALMALQKSGDLKMRIYAMLSDEKKNYDSMETRDAIKTDHMNVRSFKVYGDGALGSRGACLLQPYSDQPGHYGFLLSSPEHFDSVAAWISKKGFQMCTHAIGDSGNRTILRIYEKYLHGKNDLRWRIEHAQVINPADFAIFGMNNIIPSVQPTHATSDMYWAAVRLGDERVKGAYAYKQLLEQNNWLPLGTDFPVEDISPFKTFYAAVIRKDAKGWPDGGFQMENALTREQAIRGMTIWAAKSNFEEHEKGSIEKGKFADFVILDKDLTKASEQELLQVKVLKTILGGEIVYKAAN